MRVEDFKDDKEFIANIDKVDTDELFSQLEYYNCDGYYSHLHSAVLEELKKRAKEYEKLKEALEVAIKALEEKEADRWIPVSERLPEYSGLYLISVDDVVTVANFTGAYFMHRGGGRVEVYAWKSLPKPYESEEGAE